MNSDKYNINVMIAKIKLFKFTLRKVSECDANGWHVKDKKDILEILQEHKRRYDKINS